MSVVKEGMDFDTLRQSPVYQQALRTNPTMLRAPARFATGSDAHLRESYELRDATLRLDHIMRRALMYDGGFPFMGHLSAIKAFIETIEPRLPHMNLPQRAEGLAFVRPRLELAKQILAEADRILVQHGYKPVTSQGFHDLVVSSGYTMFQIVWDNPFYEMNQNPGPFGRTNDQDRIMYRFLLTYWD